MKRSAKKSPASLPLGLAGALPAPAPAPPPKKLVKAKLRESPSLPLPPPPILAAWSMPTGTGPYTIALDPIPAPQLAGSPAHLALAAHPSWECARCEGETDPERRTSIAAFDYLGREIAGSALALCHVCLATIRACLERKTRLTPVFAPLTPRSVAPVVSASADEDELPYGGGFR